MDARSPSASPDPKRSWDYCARIPGPCNSAVRPTSQPKKKVIQYWRRCPDPFEAVAAQMRAWFEAEPWRTSRELLERLQGEHPGVYPDGQLRTVQRRAKGWRREAGSLA